MILTATAVLLRIISNSFLNARQKELSSNVSSLCVNFNTYFLLSLFCIPLIFIMYFTTLNIEIIIWALIGGIFGALGNAFLIEALKNGELSVLGPVNSYKAVVGLIFSLLIIRETPNLTSILGIILIICGSYFIFDTTNEGFSTSLLKRKDIQFRLLALIFTGIEAVFIKKVIILSDAVCSFFLWVIFGCVFSYIILKVLEKEDVKKVKPCGFKPFLGLSALVLIMQLSTNFIFAKLPVGSALSLFQLSNILNVFLGYKLFNEKHLLKKLAGSIIMVTGSVIIILKGA